MEEGQKIAPSDVVFCTWHGIKDTSVWFFDGRYALVKQDVIIAIRESLSEISKMYVETTWN
jgi:hypothetical protein